MNTRQLASKLKVSQTTVVLSLKNHPSISEKTRKRVQRAAEKSGYRQNALVSALMAHVSKGRVGRVKGEVLAFFSAEKTEEGWKKYPLGIERAEAMRLYAEKLGFRMEHFWLGDRGCNARHIARVLSARAVRGGIILLLPRHIPPLELDWAHLPIVALGHTFLERRLHQACDNHYEGIKICYRELRALGYKKIGLFLHPINDEQTRYRWSAGFAVCSRLYGGEMVPFEPMLWPSDEGARGPAIDWFRRARPDAIISTYPDFLLHWLENEGLSVPRDFGYATLDVPTSLLGKVAGIRENHAAIAAALVDLVVEQLNANQYGLPVAPKLVEIEGNWVGGASVRQLEG